MHHHAQIRPKTAPGNPELDPRVRVGERCIAQCSILLYDMQESLEWGQRRCSSADCVLFGKIKAQEPAIPNPSMVQ